MYFKKNVYLITLLFIITSSILVLNNCNNDILNDPIFIQIGNKNVLLSEFLMTANSNFQGDSVSTNKYLEQLDNFIAAELYSSSNVAAIFRDSVEFSLDNENNILSDLLYRYKTENVSINDDYLESCYKKNNEIRIVDYVWLPDSLKKTSLRVKELLDAGEDLEYFRMLTDYNDMVSNNVLFVPKRMIKGGTLNEDLQEEAYELKDNEVKLVYTESGIHILRLFKKFPNIDNSNLKNEKKRIRKRILNAKLEERNEYFCDPLLFSKKVIVNSEKLFLVDFYFKPIHELNNLVEKRNNLIVESFYGNKVFYKEFLETLNNIPQNIKVLLTDEQLKVKTCEFIILEILKHDIEDAIDEEIKSYKENLMVEKLIQNKYLSFKEKHINKDSLILGMSDWIDEVLLTNANHSSLYSLFLSEAYKNRIEKNKFIVDKVKNHKEFLNKKTIIDKYRAINPYKAISVNYGIMDSIINESQLTNKKRIIAYYGKWELTNGEFFNYIQGLTLETKLELIDPQNCIELIKYIAKKELNTNIIDMNRLVIDKSSFSSKTDYSFLKILSEYVELSRTDIVASYDTLEISVEDLNNYFFNLSIADKKQLINVITREDFLNKLLRRISLENEINKCQLNKQNLSKNIRRSSMDSDKLFFQLYGCDLNIKPKGLEGVYFQLALKKLLEQKLDTIINEQLTKYRVYLNFDIATQLNINTDLSLYKDYFKPLEVTP